MQQKVKETKGDRPFQNIEVWTDLVNIKDLIIAVVITVTTTLAGYFIAPDQDPAPLIFGLSGAVIGFIISSIIIKPKRRFVEADKGGEQ
ncbi:hypothetical protein [Amphibacillus marinus]|uniref:hypothetical protein n=1 Tax=Amphibacillus marinus TaxID=872970 RepID=UPI001FE08D9F|nr:hypothetical protein [Amphibacillus marinus]